MKYINYIGLFIGLLLIISIVDAATTCTYTRSNSYTIVTCTGSGTATWTPSSPTYADVLIVGGGGSGGGGQDGYSYGGGGGAGGLLLGSMYATGSYTITIGQGGAAVGAQTTGNNGTNSSISNASINYIGIGGGGGGRASSGGATVGFPGGSGGGGGGATPARAGGVRTQTNISLSLVGYGNAGGTSIGTANSAGGGGATSAGALSVRGNGLTSSISGTSVLYAAGGYPDSQGSPTANTGSGGTGGLSPGGSAGADGVVVISYFTPLSVNFTSNVTGSFNPPTPVAFTDTSSSASGWSWFFGDELYNNPWTFPSSSGGWTPRAYVNGVSLANGSILIMAGHDGDSRNDTWMSTNYGATWTQITASAPWGKRYGSAAVLNPISNHIILTGGYGTDVGFYPDTWRSDDGGATWFRVNASGGWSARYGHNLACTSDGVLVLTSGVTGAVYVNDTWKSTDEGVTWTQVSASSGFKERYFAGITNVGTDVIFAGGSNGSSLEYFNDTWRTSDYGATWTRVNSSSGWSSRIGASLVTMPDNSIVILNGVNSVEWGKWARSIDKGNTWSIINSTNSIEYLSAVVVTNEGSILSMGGAYDTYKNYTLKFQPVGSSSQNPVHSYTRSGIFNVSLLAFNTSTFNIARSGYVTIYNQTLVNFTSNLTAGIIPLTVQFNDTSTNATGWAWFFGDEQYNQSWIRQTGSGGFTSRYIHGQVVTPDGTIVIAGGFNSVVGALQDIWKSTDNGVTWLLQNSSSGWAYRYAPGMVSLSDGSIIFMGGHDGVSAKNDTWISTDRGKTWTLQNISSGWAARTYFAAVSTPDDTIIISSGLSTELLNDTWKSIDKGKTWVRVNSSSGYEARYVASMVSLSDNSIIFSGGTGSGNIRMYNDTWKSTDYGAHWTLMNISSGWQPRYGHTMTSLPDNSVILVDGYNTTTGVYIDSWRSIDSGSHWSLINVTQAFTGRWHHMTSLLPDGSLILVGGYNGSSTNDSWRFNPVGSSSQNPIHTYTTSGFKNVSLQVYNSLTYNNTQKIAYINAVTSPISGFYSNYRSGVKPLTVTFNVTTINDAASQWNWSFGDGTWQNGTIQNATHTYTISGIYSVTEMATGFGVTNTTTLSNYIVVGNQSIANFTSNITFGILPNISVQFDSSNSTNVTGWAWFFGDENYTQPWVIINSSMFPARYAAEVVTLPNGHIVVIGGTGLPGNGVYNDTWKSIDNGLTWTRVNTSGGWFGRDSFYGVALSDGSIIMAGGTDGSTFYNDTWKSTDEGSTWTRINTSGGWAGRHWQQITVSKNDTLFITGGATAVVFLNDTWKSTDKGYTWTLVNSSSGWSPRYVHRTVMVNNDIILFGGNDNNVLGPFNDTWKSTDSGAHWTRVNASGTWRGGHSIFGVTMPDNSIVIVSGTPLDGIWRSNTEGSTWQLINSTNSVVGWAAEGDILPNGNLIMVGGYNGVQGTNNTTSFSPRGSSSQNPVHSYTTFGRFNVSLRTFNEVSYNDSIVPWYFRVFNFTVSGFTANRTSGAFPFHVAFNVTYPNDNATHWNWSFGDGIWHNGTDQNVTHIYNDSGSFNVTEIASLPPNVSIGTTLYNYITVGNTTVSGFVANATSGISPGSSTIAFNVTTPNDNATFWNWSFGDGVWQNGTDQNVTHVYSNGGIYTVSEIASNIYANNTTTIPNYITIYNQTVTGFTANVTNGSISHGNPNETSAIMFNVTTPNDNATQWNWSFGDGNWSNGTNQNVTYTYVFPGNFTVTEIASNAGSTNTTTVIDFIHIFDHVIPEFTANVTTGIYPLNVGFNVTNPADSATEWNWSFGDGTWQNGTTQNATHIYTTFGLFTVTEIASNPGDSHNYTLFNYIHVDNKTISGFVANVTSGVEPLAVGFNVTTGNDNATQWNWSFGDGTWQNGTSQNATHVYSNGGIYNVTEISSNPGDSNTTTLINYITVYNKTITGFTANQTSGIDPVAIGFNVTNAADNASQWNWSFGDGTWQNGTSQNATHVYSNGGLYTIIEIASNAGDSNTTTLIDYIAIYNTTMAGFTANVTFGTEPLAVGFNVTNGHDNATWWNWSFGDGISQNGTTQNASHVYSTGGSYTVVEEAYDGPSFIVEIVTNYITVYNQTHNTFTSNVSSGFIPLSVLFTATADNATTYNWSFGDGSWSNITNGTLTVLHTYISAQNYTVNLTTSDRGFGECTTTEYINATYYAPSTAFTASPLYGVVPLTVIFTDETLNGPIFWNWSFGDGSPFIFTKNASHTFTSVGTFTVTLFTNNTFGSSNYSVNITVTPNSPVASFTTNTNLGPAPLTVQFTDTSIFTAPATWLWSFGDGTTDTSQNPIHTYTSNGIYRVNLTITDAITSNKSIDTLIYVTSSLVPIPDFIGVPTSGVSPLTVQFTDLTYGGKTGWNWSFGDGNYSNVQNPSHTYVSDGQYTVSLGISNGTFTNSTTKIGYINVNVGTNVIYPNFTATPLSGNYPLTVQFTDLSVCNPLCTSWNWDLDGDGATDSNAKNPSFTYTYPVTYSPKLIISNGINSATKIRIGYIVVGPTFIQTTIPQPTGSWVPGYQNQSNGLIVSFKGDSTTDLANGTYLKYWLQNFTASGEFSVYGFVTSLMAPLMHVFGFWIFLIIWGLYIFAVWIRSQDVTLPLIIGIVSMGTFGLLFPKEALPVIIIMFVICGAIIITKLMKDSI